jgi:hypothetical protein
MDIRKILEDLCAERAEVERAISALARVGGKKRGRPPKWMKAIDETRMELKKTEPVKKKR